MLKNSALILVALGVWGVSSFVNSIGIPDVGQITDAMDLGAEGIFAAGILFMFLRIAIGSHRASLASRTFRPQR